ncbi:MAG: DUF4340 domain-containing protein, partial [Thermodesulfobacteria bacterium]|nr:DUF4340 domain-containing protein [Thermodesulfobacteriota bacterium]
AWQLLVLAVIFVGLVMLYFLQQRPQSREMAKVFITLLPELKKDTPDYIEVFSRGHEGEHLILKKGPNGWMVQVERKGKRFWALAKQNKVKKLLTDLSEFTGELRASHRSYLGDFGLGEKQGLEILLKRDGKEITVLVVGKKGPGWGTCFVKRDDENKVYLVSRDLLADFDIWSPQVNQPVQIRSWLDLQVIRQNPANIKVCSYSGKRTRWELKRKDAKAKAGQEGWIFTRGRTRKELGKEEAKRVLGQFFPLYAQDVAPPETFKISGAKGGIFQYSATNTGESSKLEIGRCSKKEKTCLVKTSAGFVFKVDNVIYKRLTRPLAVLETKQKSASEKETK